MTFVNNDKIVLLGRQQLRSYHTTHTHVEHWPFWCSERDGVAQVLPADFIVVNKIENFPHTRRVRESIDQKSQNKP